MSVETTRTGLPPYETSSVFNANVPVPPQYSLLPSSSQHVAKVTTLTQPEPDWSTRKHQPREFHATRRVPSSFDFVLTTSKEVGKPWDIYLKQLSSIHHGIALWEPSPFQNAFNDQVSIGDVGYIKEGLFYRMFNVTLPWNHPSNNRLGEPDHYKPLDWDPFANMRETTLARGDYSSHNVSSQDNSDNMPARLSQ